MDFHAPELSDAPQGWNGSNDAYCFRYSHPRAQTPAADTFLLKMLRMGPTLMVYALKKDGGAQVQSMDLKYANYL